MRIGIDIDGVLYPWTECANEALVAQFGIEDPGDHLHWDWVKEKVTKEQWAWLWSEEGQAASFGNWRRCYAGTSEAFGAILGSGHECHFVTHRDPAKASVDTALFLAHHFGRRSWAGLHVLSGAPKHQLMEWDVFIDDKPETVLDMLIQTRAQVFAPVRPWNAELAGYDTPRLIRYADPTEVAEWVISR